MMRWGIVFLLPFALACGEPKPSKKTPLELETVQTHKVAVGVFSMQAANTEAGYIDDKQLKGKVWVGVTIFTHCPGICPIVTQVFKELQAEFKDDEDFRMLSVTVDPARDTVEVLKKYAGTYGADNERWIFARHPERPAIAKFVKGNLHLQYIDEEPLIHPPHIVLVDREGNIAGMWDGTDQKAVQKLRKAIRKTLDKKKTP